MPADTINAKASDSKFKPHPEGQFVAQCVDTIDLGEKVEKYQDQPARLTHKCVLVFRTGQVNQETGEAQDIAREFTVSMGEKANLRAFLESWRGKKYTEEQVEEGVPLHKLANQFALISVGHNKGANGKTYANIVTVAGVPEMMRKALPTFAGYERDEWWTKRKKEYADESRKFKQDAGVNPDSDDFDGFESDADLDDDMPF